MRISSGSRGELFSPPGDLAAAAVAGIDHAMLPIVGGAAPAGAPLRGAPGVFGAAGSLIRLATAHPALLLETGILAAVAAALPYVAGRGLRWSAGLGAAMLVTTILALPSGAPFSLVASLAACSIAVGAFSALRSPKRRD